MRTFIALELPQDFCDEVASLANILKRTIEGRFMKRETYHLTLAFLGDINESTASKVIESIDAVLPLIQPIRLNAIGLGKFGKPHDATLHLQIQPTDELIKLAELLRKELHNRGISFDEKKFRPHITLARRARIPKGSLPQLQFPQPASAHTVTFYKSTLTSEGALYKPLYSVELGLNHATLKDCVYGLAVGDALGVPFEFKQRDTFSCTDMIGFGTHNQPTGTWSDDTSMTLALCDSIREQGCVDPSDIQSRFIKWCQTGAYTIDGLFDIGIATQKALSQGYGCSGEFDNGNGSLMRTAPLAFSHATDDEIRAVSAITHAHQISTEACVEFVHVCRALASGIAIQSALPHYDTLITIPRTEIRSSGFVLDTLKAAYWCLATTTTYKDCVLKAVNLGDDTDTTAAVTGALAGIVYGIQSIPDEWANKLRGKKLIDACLF